jgi:iron complex transport system permease protein
LGIASLLFSLTVGAADLGISAYWQWLIEGETQQQAILMLRITRMLTAFAAGAILSLCGLFMQALVRNPLADPYLLGASSGAGLGVVLITTGLIPFMLFQSIWFIPLIAFAGSCLSLFIVLGLGHIRKDAETYRLLIAGSAVSSFFTALTGLVLYKFAATDSLRNVMFWTLGSFQRSSYESAITGLVGIIVALLFGWTQGRTLDVLSLGGRHAYSLGLNTPVFRIWILLITAFCTGSITAFTGPVGFVGLMIPHFSRGFVGANHRKNTTVSAALGGVYLVGCDTIGRLMLPPAGLPIGIITALLGIPFFIFLLLRKPKSKL